MASGESYVLCPRVGEAVGGGLEWMLNLLGRVAGWSEKGVSLMRKVVLVLVLVVAAAISGCDLGIGPSTNSALALRLVLHPDVASRTFASTATLALNTWPVWTTAVARLTEIVLDYEGPTGSFSYTEPSVSAVDLLTGTSERALPSFSLQPGVYHSINFGAELLDDGATPSILLEGTWSGTPIRVVFISGEVFEAVAETLVVEEGEVYEIRLVLNPDDWFSSMTDADLAGADVGDDGFIEISENRNADLFDTHFAERVDDATQAVLPGGTPE